MGDGLRRMNSPILLLRGTLRHAEIRHLVGASDVELFPGKSDRKCVRYDRLPDRAGSKEVWLLDHANGEVIVHTATGIRMLQGTDVLESGLLPGFSAAVTDLVVNL